MYEQIDLNIFYHVDIIVPLGLVSTTYVSFNLQKSIYNIPLTRISSRIRFSSSSLWRWNFLYKSSSSFLCLISSLRCSSLSWNWKYIHIYFIIKNLITKPNMNCFPGRNLSNSKFFLQSRDWESRIDFHEILFIWIYGACGNLYTGFHHH